ncbi:unnamed protein product, partial [marine sediment metagenome]
ESFGIVLLEAMAAGLPIVGSNIAGYQCVLTQGVEGELVSPTNVEMLTNALINLLHDQERRQAYGQAGQETASKYAWEKIIMRVLNYYYELLASHV